MQYYNIILYTTGGNGTTYTAIYIYIHLNIMFRYFWDTIEMVCTIERSLHVCVHLCCVYCVRCSFSISILEIVSELVVAEYMLIQTKVYYLYICCVIGSDLKPCRLSWDHCIVFHTRFIMHDRGCTYNYHSGYRKGCISVKSNVYNVVYLYFTIYLLCVLLPMFGLRLPGNNTKLIIFQ